MEKVDYLIGLIAIIVIAAGIYFGVFYSSPMSVQVRFLNGTNISRSVYPYQNVALPIAITNTGSGSITSMNVEIDVNGQLSSYYKVTLPQSKEAVLNYNFTPTYPGYYNITATVDPGHLYNIVNRQNAQKTFDVYVAVPGKDQPYTILPKGNYTARGAIYATAIGMDFAGYLMNNYSISLDKSNQFTGFDKIFIPLFNVANNYIKSVSVEYANYSNGSYTYSVWFNSYLSDNIINTALQGYQAGHKNSVKISYEMMDGSNVTVADFGNESTLCSWYADGWMKNLMYHGKLGCYGVLLNETPNGTSAINQYHLSNKVLEKANLTEIANFTYQSGNEFSYGQILYDGREVVLPILSNKPGSEVCYGLINYINNTDYCSYYVPGKQSIYSNTSIINTYLNTKQYNISLFAVVNSSQVLSSLPTSFGILDGYNMSNKSVNFVSGLTNTCKLGNGISCDNVTFANSVIGFDLLSNKTMNLNGISCFQNPPGKITPLNLTVYKNTSVHVNAECYNGISPIGGVPLNLGLGLNLNYTVANQISSIKGTAYIVGLS